MPDFNAKKSGLDVDTVILSPMSHAGYYPGGKVMTMKVVFEKETYRLLGAQIIGYEGVDKRIDVLATAIHAGLNPLRDHMKGRIDYCVLEILKQISCVLFNTITMSDALAKVTEVLDFTEEKIVDILSDNHKVLGFFANNDLEEVKRKSEAIFSAITTSNVYQVEWAVLVLELIDWVGKLMKLQKMI